MSDFEGGDTTGLVDEITAEERAMFEGAADPAPDPVVNDEPKEEPKLEEPKADEPVVEGDEEDPDDVPLEGDLNGNKGRFVRHGAFHRQREKWKAEKTAREAAEARAAELNAQFARADERIRVLMEAMQGVQQPQQQQQQQAQKESIPDPEADPFGYMRYLEQRIEQLTGQTQEVGQRFQQQDEHAAIRTAFMQDAQTFGQQNPDFMQAYQHLMRARDRELMRLGMDNPRERADVISREERQIVSECLRRGRSAAELVYELAKDRGYTKAEAAPAAPAAAAAPAQAPAAQKPSAIAQVEAIKKGTEASRSLGSAAGGGVEVLTAESLAAMDEVEFERAVSKMTREQRRQYFGG